MHDLVLAAQLHGALVRRGDAIDGLYYRPFLNWVRSAFELDGEVLECIEAADIQEHVRDGQVFVASVSPEIRYPSRPNQRRGGHLVLVHASRDGQLTFHNPSGVRETAADASDDVDTFARFFAGRGFTLRGEV